MQENQLQVFRIVTQNAQTGPADGLRNDRG